MASANATHTHGNKPSRSSLSGPTSAASHLDKARQDARRSTPDSDVLASSDDELEKHHPELISPSMPGSKTNRRSSWLSEVQPLPQRKGSFAGNPPHSPNSSHPTTPTSDSPWATGATPGSGRGHASANSFPWGSGIWSADSRKEPPARLTEVLPSPTSIGRMGSGGFPNVADPLVSPSLREHAAESTIPFAIPLQPNVKTYRSQSYSVGQLDPESNNVPGANGPGTYQPGRGRINPTTGLQHRPSRPSMLSEFSHDGTSLGRVREAEDDDEESLSGLSGSQQSLPGPTSSMHTLESLARENALLKQEAMTQQLENLQLRNRTSSGGSPFAASHGMSGGGHPIRGGVPEDSEYAIDEIDDPNDQQFAARGFTDRRYSELSATDPLHSFSNFAFPPNPKLEVIKKGHWQSSLGFGGVPEGQQSRRHSFAEVPKRSGSISSNGDQQYGMAGGIGGLGRGVSQRNDLSGRHVEGNGRLPHGDNNAASYFGAPQASHRSGDGYNGQLAYADPYANNLPQSPSSGSNANMFSPPGHLGLSQPRQNQTLYVVTFKACRADVFYIQEGTGLQVSLGDLVIVEADRGTDLGTVANTDVPWSKAKELKESYIEEHYRWLMIFSRHSGNAANANGAGPTGYAPPHNGMGSAVGGMGPPTGQHTMQEPTAGELKPKMIKRLAQAHEIQTLKDKEANEAKAKRVCQQKVQEHRLQMEILDAEFQMDWKKLTFYYFADAYINFNSLVTDLFKIYKTRIWMSAINPASFASPSAGLQAPSGIGPGALGLQRNSPYEQRPQQDSSVYGGLGGYRAFPPNYAQPLENAPERTTQANRSPIPYAYAFAPFNQAPRQDRFASPELGAMSSPSYVPQYRPGPMGALKYVEEIHKKKQSDVLRFLLRVRCWELRQLNVIHRASRPSRPDKARRLGYKAKQGFVIYRVRVRRGGRKRPVPKGATYGKPTNQGVNQLKYQRSLRSTAEGRVGKRCANLRVLNSYWVNQDSTYKYYEVILVDPQHKAIRRDPRINWIVNPVHKHRESRGLTATGKKSRGLGKGHKFNKTTAGRRHTWKRNNTLSLWRYR
ncbi:MAG: hypothetical protein M4579_004996 [Chaenotheca gracillima]|nr:MAG: hypothetical protein M4579_004996 [Chaenotheca gracillima]